MNAKEIAGKIRTSQDIARLASIHEMADVFESIAEQVESLIPKYRPPQPSDDGRWCFIEELPGDAPLTLVKQLGNPAWQYSCWFFWTVEGWRQLTGKIWPCERPEGGGA